MSFSRVISWYQRYERFLIPLALLFGLVSDFLLFQYINTAMVFTILAGHLTLAAAMIALIHYGDAEAVRPIWRWLKYVRLFAPVILQFALGALLSSFFVFYWFSGSFFSSWPFIVLVVFLLVSNDLLKAYYLRLPVAIGVYYFILFSYFALVLPYLLSTIEPWVFVVAGLVSLGTMLLYLGALSLIVPRVLGSRFALGNIVLVIFVGLHILYFTNMIPPVPLTIRDAGVFHLVERTDAGDYLVRSEGRSPLYEFFLGTTIHRTQGSAVYVYTAIFAPTELSTRVAHHWYHYDTSAGQWRSMDRIVYPISGGRDDGYRGFTRRTNVFPGKWRVDVETERRQVIGRITFEIENAEQAPPLFDERR